MVVDLKRIAVFGWGSLIWDSGGMQLRTGWHRDGPRLPVEFARESSDKRVTLVLLDDYQVFSSTYWALSSFADLEAAAEDLKERERTIPRWIHLADSAGVRDLSGNPLDDLRSSGLIKQWLSERSDLDGAVWTGLPEKTFEPMKGNLPEQVVKYLRALPPDIVGRARNYVRLAPASIDTPVRHAIEADLGWTRISLNPRLFEDNKLRTRAEERSHLLGRFMGFVADDRRDR